MLFIFRVDASHIIGTGHVMRCLTLASELRVQGHDCQFITRDHAGNLAELINQQGYSVHTLVNAVHAKKSATKNAKTSHSAWLEVSWQEDARQTLEVVETLDVDWLIVDHYALYSDWEREVSSAVSQILVIDDLADRHHECEILLDQNWFGQHTKKRYDSLVPQACKRLLGPKYALLKPEYTQLRSVMPERDGVVRRVLVFMGGSDPGNETGKVIEALLQLGSELVAVDVVLGVNHPSPKEIQILVSERSEVRIHQSLPSLAGLMLRADLMISGGGSTTWERMCLGLPALVIGIAENQMATNEELGAAGYLNFLGAADSVNSNDIFKAVMTCLQDFDSLRVQDDLCRELVDGLGVAKTVGLMLSGSVLDSPNNRLVSRNVASNENVDGGMQLGGGLDILLLSDANSWIEPYLSELMGGIESLGHKCRLKHSADDDSSGDICFCLSFGKMVPAEFRSKFKHTLVVHESNLPLGRGWSPMSWQILEGKNDITFTLFEAENELDSGVIYSQEMVSLNGTELSSEWRTQQGLVTNRLCLQWLALYPDIDGTAVSQKGKPSYYPRRSPGDSELDLDRTIAEQFNLLRIVDNEHYPAFFKLHGKTYKLQIEKM